MVCKLCGLLHQCKIWSKLFSFPKKINLNQSKHLWPPVPQRGILTYCQYEKRWLTGREFVQICKITFVPLQQQIIFQVQKFSNHVHQGCQYELNLKMVAKAKLAPLCQEMRPKCEVLLHCQPTKVKSIQLIEATDLHYHFRLQLLQLCFRWGEHGNMLTIWRICTAARALLLKAILLTRQRTSLNISTNTISCCYLASASSTHVPQSETSLSYLCSSIFTRPLNTAILGIWRTLYLSSTLIYWNPRWYSFSYNNKTSQECETALTSQY